MDRHHNQGMQEQGKGKAPAGINTIQWLDGFTVPQQGDTTGLTAKIRPIHGNKKRLTQWHFGCNIVL
jgi:hypothetical protein